MNPNLTELRAIVERAKAAGAIKTVAPEIEPTKTKKAKSDRYAVDRAYYLRRRDAFLAKGLTTIGGVRKTKQHPQLRGLSRKDYHSAWEYATGRLGKRRKQLSTSFVETVAKAGLSF